MINLKAFGLFLLFTVVSASYNLYLNEHETMRLLGKQMIITFEVWNEILSRQVSLSPLIYYRNLLIEEFVV